MSKTCTSWPLITSSCFFSQHIYQCFSRYHRLYSALSAIKKSKYLNHSTREIRQRVPKIIKMLTMVMKILDTTSQSTQMKQIISHSCRGTHSLIHRLRTIVSTTKASRRTVMSGPMTAMESTSSSRSRRAFSSSDKDIMTRIKMICPPQVR